MLGALGTPMDPERRRSVAILVAARWLLVATSFVAVDYRADVRFGAGVTINVLIAGAAALNLLLHRRLHSERALPYSLPILVGVFDAASITCAVAVRDGYQSTSFILYYPALLAFSIIFPGRWSEVYAAATAAGYVLVLALADPTFDLTIPLHQKVMLLRLATMATTVLIGNLVVQIERSRRERAVFVEAERGRQVLALEARAFQAERALQAERRRLSREVHDGVSQSVYMLALGLETAAAVETRRESLTGGNLDALVRLAKGTLLETRSLLFDLEGVMAGQTSLAALVRNQAAEFQAVTGIPTSTNVTGDERPLSPAAIGDLYRVLQEGLANIYKHARAGAASLRLDYADGAVELEIADDGAGFDEHGRAARGHGLRNMRERVEQLGGCFELRSAAGGGTRLTSRIPLAAGGAESPASS